MVGPSALSQNIGRMSMWREGLTAFPSPAKRGVRRGGWLHPPDSNGLKMQISLLGGESVRGMNE